MFLINQAMVNVPIGTAALIVVLGMAVVFFGLILLMLVTKASGKIMQNKEAAAKAAAPAPAPAAPAVPAVKAFAPGSAGEVKLHDVPDRTAAMLMAIVADKLGKPLNELRFISIREIKDRSYIKRPAHRTMLSVRCAFCPDSCIPPRYFVQLPLNA